MKLLNMQDSLFMLFRCYMDVCMCIYVLRAAVVLNVIFGSNSDFTNDDFAYQTYEELLECAAIL